MGKAGQVGNDKPSQGEAQIGCVVVRSAKQGNRWLSAVVQVGE